MKKRRAKSIEHREKRLKIILLLALSSWLLALSPLLFADSCFAAEEKFFEIKAKKFSYTPNIIKVNKGDLVRIRLISEDVTHGMFIDGYGLNTQAHPGQDGNLTFTADKRGRFSFRCSVTCGEFHPYMIGYIIIEPNARYLAYILLIALIGLISLFVINLRARTNERK